MLALIAAFCFLMIIILFFALGYVRLLGSSSEQKTAIEAAALAAARDISKIVLDTPEFGLIGISDSAPKDTTAAADTFCVPVHSINTLIGTARLDYIVGDAMSISEWRELALVDLNAARTRANDLVALLDNAITPTGSATDKLGNTVTPYISAETAYTQNQIRMTGASNYVAGSLALSLGAKLDGAATNIPIPRPVGTDPSLDTTNTLSTGVAGEPPVYKSYTNYPFDSQDFVFAGIGDSVRLIDPKLWRANLTGLPWYHRTIIRAEAEQNVSEEGTNQVYTIKAAACAQPASVYDPRPKPGALQISFPDGMPEGPEDINRPTDLYGALLDNPDKTCDYYRSNNGDYPVTGGSTITIDTTSWPLASDPIKRASSACKLAVYDWLRRAGTKANVSSFMGSQGTPFNAQGADVPWGSPVTIATIPRGVVHIYRWEPNGLVSYESLDQQPQPYYVVSENQVFMEAFEVIEDGIAPFEIGDPPPPNIALGPPINANDGVIEFGSGYDMHIRLYCRRPGTTSGGRHAGEPMDNALVATSHPAVKLNAAITGGKASVDSMMVCGKGAASKKWWMKKAPPPTSGSVGAPPEIIGRVDFMQSAPGVINTSPSWYEKFDATGGGLRFTYRTENGTVSDIRFRRCLAIWSAANPLVEESGYVGSRNP